MSGFKPPVFRTAYNHDLLQRSNEFVFHNTEPSMTVQSMAEDADINVLMHRFGVTGKMPENPRVPSYGDFTEVLDYRSALDAVRQADEKFAELPAAARAFFGNDPQQLMAFASDPANLPKLRELGLAKPEVIVNAQEGSPGGSGSGSGSGRGGAGSASAGDGKPSAAAAQGVAGGSQSGGAVAGG